MYFTKAPILLRILTMQLTSLILGIFSMRQTSCASKVAGIIATAAFFAPLISTEPHSLLPPFIISFSKTVLLFSPLSAA